jgi:hypothetical protein
VRSAGSGSGDSDAPVVCCAGVDCLSLLGALPEPESVGLDPEDARVRFEAGAFFGGIDDTLTVDEGGSCLEIDGLRTRRPK